MNQVDNNVNNKLIFKVGIFFLALSLLLARVQLQVFATSGSLITKLRIILNVLDVNRIS